MALGLLAFAAQSMSIATIEAKGSKFFLSTGQQFFNKGKSYPHVVISQYRRLTHVLRGGVPAY